MPAILELRTWLELTIHFILMDFLLQYLFSAIFTDENNQQFLKS